SQAARHNPNVLYAPLLLPDSVRLARERGTSTAARAALLGGRRMASDEFIEQAGTQAEGGYAITPSSIGNGRTSSHACTRRASIHRPQAPRLPSATTLPRSCLTPSSRSPS